MFRPASVALLPGIALGPAALALALAACAGAGNEGAGTESPVPARTSAAAPETSPTAQRLAASPTVASTPRPTTTPAASEADRAAQAAAAIFGGVVDAACTPSPETPVCIIPEPSMGTPQHGTAAFGVFAGDGYMGFLGYTPEGEWKFWFGAQNITYQLRVLPGDMRVCTGGAGLNVRASPAVDSEAVTLLNDDTIITVDRFLLTEPGMRSPTTGTQAGFGWYHLTSPKEGWAFSKYLSAASLGDCSVHDLQLRN